MKCPTCESCEYAQYCGATEIMRKCERHNKKVKQTNEEWFCSLSTEEKAKFLVMIEMSAMHPVKRGSIDTKKFIEDVTEWLKQPHKE